MTSTPLLQLEGICCQYDEGTLVLKDVSVEINKGERIAVLGNNGAGKSTFFLCCNGVLEPAGGTLCLNGSPLRRKKADLMRLRQAVGLVFQDPDNQIIASTVESEISFGPMNLRLERGEVARRVDDAIAEMALESYRERPPHYLSGGEKKRVTIADILAMHPQMILFDEPTSSLDPQNTLRLQGILQQLSQNGMALVVATHDLDFAWEWAERVLVFHNGALIANTSPKAVFSDNALLETAGLQKPVLYAAVEALCKATGVGFPEVPPRNIESFTLFVKELLS